MLFLIRRYSKPMIVIILTTVALSGCGSVAYNPSGDYLNDGELLNKSIREAVAKCGENRVLNAENAPFVIESLSPEDEAKLLYDSFEDALAAELSTRGLDVAGAEAEEASVIKYRLAECRIINVKADGGRVKRVGKTVAHVRIYGKADGQLFWAGEYEGEYENVVPKGVVKKLKDERVVQIGPTAPEGGKNPFLEPLLVTGITGALIYLFAASASSD